MDKEKQFDIVSRYHAKNDLANALYQKQDEFDLSNPFEVANCVINLGYRKINENEVVISKKEWELLQNDLDKHDYGEFESGYSQGSKETAREILERGKYCMPSGLREWIEKQFGVDIGEDK